MSTELVNRFASLFDGRHDAVGLDNGGCLRIDPEDFWLHIHDHLLGVHPMGVYPVRNVNQVKWGCVDLDVKKEGKTRYDYETPLDAHVAAVNLRKALGVMGVPAYIERTRSDGRHVWVFASSWLPAAAMRHALLVACSAAGVPPTEVNPKQETLRPPAIGNYVRLPYPGSLANDHNPLWSAQKMLDGIGEYNWSSSTVQLNTFLDEVEEVHPMTIEALAELYVPRESVSELSVVRTDLSPLIVRKLSGLSYTIFKDGPLDGGDRSGTLYKLAIHLKEDQLTASEAVAVLTDADLRWGKYYHRPNADVLIKRTLEKAWNNT